MEKKINLLGIRKKAMLFRTEFTKFHKRVYLLPITEKDELNFDKKKYFLNGEYIEPSDIISYGEHNIDTEKGQDDICTLPILDEDNGGIVRSRVNFETGEQLSNEDGVFQSYPTFDKVTWFRYNLMLIGNPERVLILKTLIPRYEH